VSSYLEIQLAQQPIELCKLLKVADLVGGGGEAKVVISEGYVLLNGEVEFQKRKKIYHNDIVEFNGEVIQVIVDEDLTAQLSEPENKTPPVASPSPSSHKQKNTVEQACNTKGSKKRKPISF
jgi:ribosome-associated protein